MVLIEMHMSNPGMRSQYIWSIGEKWPVPSSEDAYVTRIEAFGEELKEIQPHLPGGRQSENYRYPVVDWTLPDAPYISELMRAHAGSVK